MIIRKLEKKELFDAYLISAFCFHMRVEDPEAQRERLEAEAETQVNWGAFDEDGTLTARIIDYRLPLYLNGRQIPAGGIGSVPKRRGAVRAVPLQACVLQKSGL